MAFKLHVLTAAASLALVLTSVAEAQRYGAPAAGLDPTALSRDTQRINTGQYQSGMTAIANKNFENAENIFEEILRQKIGDADASFYAGVAEMSLGKWEEARAHLEVAAKKKPKEPDPKSRLGITLAKLGDTAGAMEQRAALEKMDKDCKGTCKNAQFIAGGIAMIDSALPMPTP
ncbi:MAG TPA: tetratricopeptide repeat protein [Hyphomonadaceae bacterium]|nr:tetratricopeptide repeat protein [Hyphomonadaceae bacterium]